MKVFSRHRIGYLRKGFGYMFESDQEALAVLDENFEQVGNGVLCRKHRWHSPTPKEREAIKYLIDEWDFIYRG